MKLDGDDSTLQRTGSLSDLLSPTQLSTLAALADTLIPADEFPSAWEGGFGDYLSGLLREPLAQALPSYRAGLDAMDAEARAWGAASFDLLPTTEREALLSRVERGEVLTLWEVDAADFFRELCSRVAEGYYGDPGNHGNRGGASWRMLGFVPSDADSTTLASVRDLRTRE